MIIPLLLTNLVQGCFSVKQMQHIIFFIRLMSCSHLACIAPPCFYPAFLGAGKDVHNTSAMTTTSRACGVYVHPNFTLALWLRDLREGLKQAAKAEQQQQHWRQDQSVELQCSQQDNRLYASSSMPLDRLPSITLSVSPRQSLQRGKCRAESDNNTFLERAARSVWHLC